MKTYTLEAVKKTAQKYEKAGGEVKIIKEGALLDDMVLICEGYPTIVCTAVYLNEWSSAYTVRQYKKTPEKYLKAVAIA